MCARAPEQEVLINDWGDELRRRKMCQREADMLLVALLVVSMASVALGSIVDTKYPIAFEPESSKNEGSLFGYSLALTKKMLYVGAPAHDVQGAVYQCDMDKVDFEVQERQVQGHWHPL